MSTATAVITVPIARATYERLSQRASEENRTVSEILEDTIMEAERVSEERRILLRRSAEALAGMQEDSIRNGTSGMTLDEINEEIAAARRDMAQLARTA